MRDTDDTGSTRSPTRGTLTGRGGRRPDLSLEGGLIVATLLHVGVFAFGPTWTVDIPRSADSTPPEILALPDIDIPDSPDPIDDPAGPVVGATAATVEVETWLPKPIVEAPDPAIPPPGTRAEHPAAGLPFTPMTVRPTLRNPEEVRRRMEAEYPPLLRDARVGGTVVLHLHVSAEGKVLAVRVGESSRRPALDRAALRVADTFRFDPAVDRDRAVAVWVAFPVIFTARDVHDQRPPQDTRTFLH